MVEEPDCHDILSCVLHGNDEAVILVDAGGLPMITELGASLRKRFGRVIITPHTGVMANLLCVDIEVVETDPSAARGSPARCMDPVEDHPDTR